MREAQLGSAEQVDDIDRALCVDRLAERSERRDAKDVAFGRVDRQALIALVDQVAKDAEGWPPRIRRRADDRDPVRRPEDLAGGIPVEHGNRSAALLEVEIGNGPRPFCRTLGLTGGSVVGHARTRIASSPRRMNRGFQRGSSTSSRRGRSRSMRANRMSNSSLASGAPRQ